MGQDANPPPAQLPHYLGHYPRHWPDDLCHAFAALPSARSSSAPRWVVALSGGLDSVFLLHCLAQWVAQLRSAPARSPSLSAIHINHGLQPEAAQWAAFCHAQCQALELPLITHSLSLDPGAADLEATAREARYQVFSDHVNTDDVLLMAHHGDDQAETVMLRLMRGSGVRGLAGMPASRPLGPGQLHRPLLGLSRQRIETLARQWGLRWCEDGSNQNQRFDRNYLRHRVLPGLQQRWPAAAQNLTRSAAHCREADQLLEDLAREDSARLQMADGVTVSGLQQLSEPRQRNLVRYRLRQHGLRPPGEEKLNSGLNALLSAGQDRAPALHWEGYSLRRYRNGLWLLPDLPPVDNAARITWDMQAPLLWAGSPLVVVAGHDHAPVTVTFRQGGERLRPAPGQPSRPLKKWLQEQGVAPWVRERLPLIWNGTELIAVAGLWQRGAGQFTWESLARPL